MTHVQDNSNSPPLTKGVAETRRLAKIADELTKIRDQCEDREQLLTRLAGFIIENTNAGVLFWLNWSPQDPDGTTIVPLASRYKTIPLNIEHWATNVAIRACLTGESQLETTHADEATFVQVAEIVRSESREGVRASIVALFESKADQFIFESALLRHMCQTVAIWDIEQSQTVETVAHDLAALNDLKSRIESAESVEDACKSLGDQLCEFINSRIQVTTKIFVGVSDEQNDIELVAISDQNSIAKTSEEVEQCEAAMRECLGRGQGAEWPPAENQRHALLCHQRFAASMPTNHIVTIPLLDVSGKLQGVTMVTSPTELPPRIKAFLNSMSAPVASSLGLLKKAQKGRIHQFLLTVKEAAQEKKAKTFGMGILLVAILSLVPMPYTVNSSCKIQPLKKRVVAAPFEGQLKETTLRPGDHVSKGQILATLDEQEINFELAEIEADLHRAIKVRTGFIATHEPGKARVAEFDANRLTARQKLLKHRNNSLEITSPIDGIIVSGDLKHSAGVPVAKGEGLFEIAELNNLSAELYIPEDDVRYLKPGQTVRISLDAFPFEILTGKVERIHPSAEILENKNVFVATVLLDEQSDRLMPGMNGSTKTRTVWRPICWNLFHKPAATCLRYFGW